MIENITPLLLTFNEKNNIHRTIPKLNLFEIIIVIDSYSNDETVEKLKTYPQVQVFQRKFDTFANQWNYGLEQVKTDWVLSLDADYRITDEFISELDNLADNSVVDGYFTCFKYCVFGKPLRGTLLPPRLVLFRREKAFYFDDGHTQKLHLNGRSGQLLSYIYHDDRKPLSRWINSQDRYMILEAQKLIGTPTSELSIGDRIRRKKIIAPFIILFYCLILKGGILDGWAGWYYALQRMLAEILLAIHLIEAEKANDIAQKQ
ncbi:glycosyltransferase family 2 protein [Coleofasciculus chthonoplastes]|jgi:glycosyltransferase involved in cell wall biosynthesis|uniref:glycosyltransferase family 2 protein n=1 Tax=Coleofasciculus chthonoplastes TaxID=64178 RepID=UPI0032F4652C